MYESPQVDVGYDISDYEAVHGPYGTMEDMDRLIKQCHGLGMCIILDLVIKYTTSEHAWFTASWVLGDNPKRDWYLWHPPTYDGTAGKRLPPNNWCGTWWQRLGVG